MSLAIRRVMALLALAAFSGVITLSAVGGHSVFADDRACGDPVLQLSTDGPALASAEPVTVPQHCALCHLQRAASGASPAAPVAALFSLIGVDAAPAPHPVSLPHQLVVERPSRAPPALLLS